MISRKNSEAIGGEGPIPSNLVKQLLHSADSPSELLFDSDFLDLEVFYLQIVTGTNAIAPFGAKPFSIPALSINATQHRLDSESIQFPKIVLAYFRSAEGRQFHWVRSVSKTRIPSVAFFPNQSSSTESYPSEAGPADFRLFDLKKIRRRWDKVYSTDRGNQELFEPFKQHLVPPHNNL